jgi:enoyl-CoA hydratase/carnithine racemase
MNTLKITLGDTVAVISLDRGRSNAINHEMISDLSSAFKMLEEDVTVAGVILTGKPGFFSSGIDLIEAFGYNEQQIKDFWIDFLALQRMLISFKKPLVAAINGHSPAGGCVLAIGCDYRLMAEGPFIIGLNEVPVGIIVPDSIFHVYAFWLGQRRAYQYLLEGKLLQVQEALASGLIDEVHPAEQLMAAAEKKIKTYMSFNAVTWSQSKVNLRKELLEKISMDQTAVLALMLKQWWSQAVMQGLQMMIENLKAKSAAKA